MAFDRRWAGVNVLPVTLLLFIFSITLIGLCAFENSSEINVMGLVTLNLVVITAIHTILDIFLYFTSRLKPLYVLVLACILMVTWLGNAITEVIVLVYIDLEGSCSASYGYYHWNEDADHYGKLCRVSKGRVVLSVCVLILYIAAITLSAIANKRYRRARFEKHVNEAAVRHSTNPPAMACPSCGTQMVATQQCVSTPAISGCDLAGPDYSVERDHKVLLGAENKDEKYP